MEDAAKWSQPAEEMDLANQAGFDSIRLSAQWSTGLTAPPGGELTGLQNAVQAAAVRSIDPIVSMYGEFGVESIIPAAKASAYSGVEPSTTQPVPEAVQAQYYTESFKLALCQPNVIGIMVFHVSDESALAGGGTLVVPAGVTVSSTAADDVGVGRVELSANGVVVATKFLPPYTFAWNPSQTGPTTLELRAYDAAGNVGRAFVDVVADVIPPETTIGSQTPPFAFSASEDATFACSLDGGAFAPCTCCRWISR